MNRPCARAITCPGPTPGLEGDSPIVNYSAEQDDGVEFKGIKFPPWTPYNPDRPGWWASQACDGFFTCVSYVSQEAADDCARVLADLCAYTPQPPTTPPCLVDPDSCVDPPTMFGNNPQSCSIECPDGTTFTYTVPAGSFVAPNEAYADYLARTAACQRVAANFICFPMISDQPCDGVPYSALFTITGQESSYVIEMIGGILPPGLSFTQVGPKQFVISGTPELIGNYSITVRATSPLGIVAEYTYQIGVMGILNDSTLTGATKDSAYSEQLTADGGTAPYTFVVSGGSLPTGISMDIFGTFSGTPTVEETAYFTVDVTDAFGRLCSKVFSIAVTATADCHDWSLNTWSYVPFAFGPIHSEVYSASGNSFSGAFTAEQQFGSPSESRVVMKSNFVLNTTADCCGRVSVTSSRAHAPSVDEFFNVLIGYADGTFEILGIFNPADGDYDFTIPSTGGVDDTIYVSITIKAASSVEGVEYSMSASGTFSTIPCP